MIFQASGGITRKINALCDKAMVYGFSQGVKIIDAELVMEVIRDRAEYGVLPTAQENAAQDPSGGRVEDDGAGCVGRPQAANEAIPQPSNDAVTIRNGDQDPLFDEAVRVVRESGSGSVSGVQRRLNIRYNRVVRLVQEMERIGVVSEADERGSRQVLVSSPAED